MKISKKALHYLPVMMLLESLTPVITLGIVGVGAIISKFFGTSASAVTAISSSLVLLSIWIIGSVFVYGIMELSRYFKYSWYMHIGYLVIKAVIFILDSISAVGGDSFSDDTENVYDIMAEVLSTVRQFTGLMALCFAMLGLRAVMIKLKEENKSRKCRRYAYSYIISAILFAVDDIASMVVTMLYPDAENTLVAVYLPVLIVYFLMNLFITVISIPSFMTARSSCKTIYDMLSGEQEL